MVGKAFKKERVVQVTMTAEEVAKITGFTSVENMMKKYPSNGMEGAIRATFGPMLPYNAISWQKMP
jgi:hypothetical protein